MLHLYKRQKLDLCDMGGEQLEKKAHEHSYSINAGSKGVRVGGGIIARTESVGCSDAVNCAESTRGSQWRERGDNGT